MKTKINMIGAAVALLVASISHATETSTASVTAGIVSPSAQYSYAESAKCLSAITRLNRLQNTWADTATAMLGRLPACEVKKILLALENKQLNAIIED